MSLYLHLYQNMYLGQTTKTHQISLSRGDCARLYQEQLKRWYEVSRNGRYNARFKAIYAIRRRARFDAALPTLGQNLDDESIEEIDWDNDQVEDDRLRLIFTCCHPALPPDARIALTLREICGLTTEAIAHASAAGRRGATKVAFDLRAEKRR